MAHERNRKRSSPKEFSLTTGKESALVPAEQWIPPDGEEFRAQGEGSLPPSHYYWLLRSNIWIIIAAVGLAVVATLAITRRLTPIYQSTAILYVDRGALKNIVGKDASASSQSIAGDDATFMNSQINLISSDSVVRPVAEKYRLLEKEGQILPGKDSALRISKIQAAPIALKGLTVSRRGSTYLIQINYQSPDPNVAAAVANGVANSYIEHIYDIRIRSSASMSRFMIRQLDELRAKMEASSARLGVIQQDLVVINPQEKTDILSSRLLQINTEYTKAQTERVRAESNFESLSAGSIEAALSTPQGDEVRALIKRLNEARQRFVEVKTHFLPKHPEYLKQEAAVTELQTQIDATVQSLARQAGASFQRAQRQEALLQKEVADTKAEYDHLNLRSFEYQKALHEADADRALYEELVKRINEDQINSGFQNDMIRIADAARPAEKAVFPHVLTNLLLAFFVSTFLMAALVILVDRLDTTLKDPDQVARTLGARVVGAIPLVDKGRAFGGMSFTARRTAAITAGTDRSDMLNTEDTRVTGFNEAIRTARNSILLSDFDRRMRTVLLTSAAPSEGKSTIAAHLALSHADQKYKTLLIDGDMRRPSIHRLFGISNSNGLSRVLDKNTSWKDALIRPHADLELYVLPAGPPSRRAADLVGQSLVDLLDEASKEFDLVLLDGPPLLGFSEPLRMAVATDGVIVVVKAGQTDRSAVSAVLNTLGQLRVNIIGVILNEVQRNMSKSYYYVGNYGKYYAQGAAAGGDHDEST
jgi:succinoglycan biosynthesis transport protein ExoP